MARRLLRDRPEDPAMAREPFSGNADRISGVGGYNTTDARSPALGRSSRDLASDSGPGAAPERSFTTPDTDTETLTGPGRDSEAGALRPHGPRARAGAERRRPQRHGEQHEVRSHDWVRFA